MDKTWPSRFQIAIAMTTYPSSLRDHAIFNKNVAVRVTCVCTPGAFYHVGLKFNVNTKSPSVSSFGHALPSLNHSFD